MEQVPALPDHLLDLEVTSIARPVFLVGCARSGTSILGEIIAVHPRVTYLYEVSAIWNRVLPGRRDHRLTPADATAEVIERLHQELGARMPDPRRDLLVEKNPKHTLRIGFLDAAFPDGRIIHLIRDGRDTVASLMFRNRGPSWGHLKVPGWEELLARYPEDNHVRCAYQWRDSVALGRGEGLSLPAERSARSCPGSRMPRRGPTMPAGRCVTTSTTISAGWAASARTSRPARSRTCCRSAATSYGSWGTCRKWEVGSGKAEVGGQKLRFDPLA